MISVKLGSEFYQCPEWWKKFVEETHRHQLDNNNDDEVAMMRINTALHEYSARTEYIQGIAYVHFNDDAKYTWFMLQWS